MSFAHQLAVLRDGNLCQVGPPREVYWRPVDLFTARFLGDAVVLPATIGDGFAVCALGTVAVAPTSLRGDACIMLRPEQIVVDECEPGVTDAGASMPCTGQVEAVDFYGPEVQLAVRLFSGGAAAPASAQSSGGTLVHVRQHGAIGTAVGSRVTLAARGTATAFAARP